MNFEEFTQNVKENIKHRIDSDKNVMLQTVQKNNGMTYEGLVIIDPLLNISPTIYLEPFYHNYLNGTPLPDIYDNILHVYEEFVPENDFDVTLFTDYEKAKERIIMKLINQERNQDLLKKIPYIPFLDLAIVFVCAACDFNREYATILIYNEHMLHWGIDVNTLYQVAQKNTPYLLPFHFEDLENYLTKHTDWPSCNDHLPMYLLTNRLKIHGACVMIYEGMLEWIAKELNSSFVIIPSSVHETLIIPVSSKKELSSFTRMLIDVNTTQLSKEEILSDQAYYYSKTTHTLS